MEGYGADEEYAKALGIPYSRPESGVEKAEREDWERREEIKLQNQPSNSELVKEIRELKELLKGSYVNGCEKSNIYNANNKYTKMVLDSNILKDVIDIQPKG